MDEILIPPEKLKDGFEKQSEQIELLLESSEILLKNEKYSHSLSFSILAHEEVAKLRTIRQHLLQNKGITRKEWIDLTKGGSHKEKLIKHSKDKKKHLEETGHNRFEASEVFKNMINDPLSLINSEIFASCSDAINSSFQFPRLIPSELKSIFLLLSKSIIGYFR